DPSKNTAPWFTINNPIALVYNPQGAAVTVDNAQATPYDVGYVRRFSTAATTRLFESKNGDPYAPGQAGDVKQPKVLTVGVDPANRHQLLFGDHGKTSPSGVLAIIDRSDLGLHPNLGSLRVRIQLPKVT